MTIWVLLPILDNFRQYGVWQGMGEGRVAHSQLAACFSLAYFHTFFTSKRLCCVFCYKNAVNQGFWSKTAASIKQLFLAFLQQKCIFRWFMVNLLVLSEIISFKKVQKGKILSTTIKGNCAQIRELKGRLWQRRPSSYKSYAALHSKVHSEFFWEIWILHFIAACSERLLERTK